MKVLLCYAVLSMTEAISPTKTYVTTAIDWENWGVTESNVPAGGHGNGGHYDQYDLIKDYSNYKEWTQDEWNLAYRAFQETLQNVKSFSCTRNSYG